MTPAAFSTHVQSISSLLLFEDAWSKLCRGVCAFSFLSPRCFWENLNFPSVTIQSTVSFSATASLLFCMFVRSFWLLYYMHTHTRTHTHTHGHTHTESHTHTRTHTRTHTDTDHWCADCYWCLAFTAHAVHSRSRQGRLCQCVMYWLKQGDNEIVCACWKCIHWVNEFGQSCALCVWRVICSVSTVIHRKLLVEEVACAGWKRIHWINEFGQLSAPLCLWCFNTSSVSTNRLLAQKHLTK